MAKSKQEQIRKYVDEYLKETEEQLEITSNHLLHYNLTGKKQALETVLWYINSLGKE